MVRLLTGVLLAAAFFALVWFGSVTVLLVVALGVSTLAVHEYARLVRRMGMSVPVFLTLVATWAVLAVVPFSVVALESVLIVGLAIISVSVIVRTESGGHAASGSSEGQGAGPAVEPRGPMGQAVHDTAISMLAPVYFGLPFGSLVGVHVLGGRGSVLLLLATIVVSDSAQFYSGRLFGRHALAPRLSPKKTIEGALGGLVLGPVFFVVAAHSLLPAATNRLALAAVGVLLVVAGIAGDFFESMLKRGAGVKDSSALIPGHGGVLDRVDALLFAAPVFYMYLRFLYEPYAW